jgi:hypothetical protein
MPYSSVADVMIVPTCALSQPYVSDSALFASGKLYRAMYIAA